MGSRSSTTTGRLGLRCFFSFSSLRGSPPMECRFSDIAKSELAERWCDDLRVVET